MILLTGASGFLGRHLLHQLCADGKKIRALYNRKKPADALFPGNSIEWMQCDLLDIYDVEKAIEDVAEIYHCAAIVSFDTARKDEIIHANICSTAHLVNAALEADVRKMVHVSSIAALGRNAGKKEINEEAEWEENALNSVYGQSKQGAEMEVWRGIGEGMNAVIINPGIILGEPFSASQNLSEKDDWNNGSVKLMKVVNDEFPFYTDGVTGWVDVLDVAKAMQLLMAANISGERFILSSGNASYRDVFTKMATSLGKKRPYIHANKWMTELVWRVSVLKSKLTGEEAIITKETATNAQTQSVYDASKLQRELTDFSYTPLAATIERMAAAFIRTMGK